MLFRLLLSFSHLLIQRQRHTVLLQLVLLRCERPQPVDERRVPVVAAVQSLPPYGFPRLLAVLLYRAVRPDHTPPRLLYSVWHSRRCQLRLRDAAPLYTLPQTIHRVLRACCVPQPHAHERLLLSLVRLPETHHQRGVATSVALAGIHRLPEKNSDVFPLVLRAQQDVKRGQSRRQSVGQLQPSLQPDAHLLLVVALRRFPVSGVRAVQPLPLWSTIQPRANSAESRHVDPWPVSAVLRLFALQALRATGPPHSEQRRPSQLVLLPIGPAAGRRGFLAAVARARHWSRLGHTPALPAHRVPRHDHTLAFGTRARLVALPLALLSNLLSPRFAAPHYPERPLPSPAVRHRHVHVRRGQSLHVLIAETVALPAYRSRGQHYISAVSRSLALAQ